jgi:hypothetical protein
MTVPSAPRRGSKGHVIRTVLPSTEPNPSINLADINETFVEDNHMIAPDRKLNSVQCEIRLFYCGEIQNSSHVTPPCVCAYYNVRTRKVTLSLCGHKCNLFQEEIRPPVWAGARCFRHPDSDAPCDP